MLRETPLTRTSISMLLGVCLFAAACREDRGITHAVAQVSPAGAAGNVAGSAVAPRGAAASKYGDPGEPIHLVVGYQPYYSEAWSGIVVMTPTTTER